MMKLNSVFKMANSGLWRHCVQISTCKKHFSTAYVHAINDAHDTKMLAWQIHSYGGLEELQLNKKVRKPTILRPDEVVIKVSATSVNPIDVVMSNGYGSVFLNTIRQVQACRTIDVEFPLILGRDFCGEIVEKGHGVGSRLNVGDTVYGVVEPYQQGAHAQYVLARESCVDRKPRNLTAAEAASLPYASMTAWCALKVFGDMCILPARGKRVLVLGGSGGVGNIAIQLLKAWGAEVVATCKTDAVPLVESFGAECVIDYTQPHSERRIKEEGKYDVILNAAGKAEVKYLDNLKEWSWAKYISLSSPLLRNTNDYGFLGGMVKNTLDFLIPNVVSHTRGSSVRWGYFLPLSAALKDITTLAEQGKVTPTIDRVYPFSELTAAYQKVSEGHARGKTVISVNTSDDKSQYI